MSTTKPRPIRGGHEKVDAGETWRRPLGRTSPEDVIPAIRLAVAHRGRDNIIGHKFVYVGFMSDVTPESIANDMFKYFEPSRKTAGPYCVSLYDIKDKSVTLNPCDFLKSRSEISRRRSKTHRESARRPSATATAPRGTSCPPSERGHRSTA